jgi:hypothetical protein
VNGSPTATYQTPPAITALRATWRASTALFARLHVHPYRSATELIDSLNEPSPWWLNRSKYTCSASGLCAQFRTVSLPIWRYRSSGATPRCLTGVLCEYLLKVVPSLPCAYRALNGNGGLRSSA